MNSYELSRAFWDYAFENPEKIKPIHSSIYFFSIEHCNRLGWKQKFGLPSQMVMEAIGVKNWRTYSKGLNDLVEWGFVEMIEKSVNQYSSNIVAIVNFTKADTKALDKALQKHSTKQGQSTVSIDKQYNKEQDNNITIKEEILNSQIWLDSLGMKLKIPNIKELLIDFVKNQELEVGEGNGLNRNLDDVKNHFVRWVKLQPEAQPKKAIKSPTDNLAF